MASSVFQSRRGESSNCSGINEIKYTKYETIGEKKGRIYILKSKLFVNIKLHCHVMPFSVLSNLKANKWNLIQQMEHGSLAMRKVRLNDSLADNMVPYDS